MALIPGHLLRVHGQMDMIWKQNHFKPVEIFDGLKAPTAGSLWRA